MTTVVSSSNPAYTQPPARYGRPAHRGTRLFHSYSGRRIRLDHGIQADKIVVGSAVRNKVLTWPT